MKKISVVNKSKWLVFAVTFLILFGSTLTCMAQGDDAGCSYTDPDVPLCPLDSWVVVLVIAMGVFAVIQLRRKQKSLNS